MENIALKTKFRSLLPKTGKINFDFGVKNGSSFDDGRIPPEWAQLVAVAGGSRRDEGVFVATNGDTNEDDDDILSGMEAAYFTEEGFDPTLFELEGLEVPGEMTELSQLTIDERRKTLLKQLKVVTKKAYGQILDKRPQCVEEMTKVTSLEDSLVMALNSCMISRQSLESARSGLVASSLGMLAAARRRQRIDQLLQNLTIIATLQKTDVRLQELLAEGEFPAAIQLLLEAQQAVKTYSHFHAIRQLSLKLQDTLDFTEEKLDVALSKVCCDFNSDQYRKIQEAYSMLGRTQTSMDQLQMHITSAVHNTSWNVVYGHAVLSNSTAIDAAKRAYPDICAMVADECLLPCLVDLCKAFWLIMRSYKQIVYWHKVESENSDPDQDLDRHLERQYVQRKLSSGLVRIWQDVQTKVRVLVVAKEVGARMNISDFLHLMHILHRLIEFGHEFCGSESDTLQESLKDQCMTYFKQYHRHRLEDLRMHLENESWTPCPIKESFKLTQLKEYQDILQSFSETGSPKNRAKYFDTPRKESCKKNSGIESPFDQILAEALKDSGSEELILKTDMTDLYNNDSDFDDEELSHLEIIDERNQNEKKLPRSSSKRKSPVATNTSVMLLRLFGNYLHLMEMLRPISTQIFEAMMTLVEYYAFVVHHFFGLDPEADSQTYFGYCPMSPRLQSHLKMIKQRLAEDTSNNTNEQDLPKLPTMSPTLIDDFSNVENLNGFRQKYVGVESVLFVVDQLRLIRKILEHLVVAAASGDSFVESYFTQTLVIYEDLRRPVYWGIADKSFSFEFILGQMSRVSWDVQEVRSQHNQYVDLFLRELQMFCIRLQEIDGNEISVQPLVLRTIWELIALAASFLFVEGFSNAKKCSNEGRALMQLDFRQFVLKLEAVSDLKPLPHQELVSNYIKAFYIPETELEDWVKQHSEYTSKQLMSLVNCVAYSNNRTKQRLDAIINELSTFKLSIRK